MSDSRLPNFLGPVLAKVTAPAALSVCRRLPRRLIPPAVLVQPAVLAAARRCQVLPPAFANIKILPVPCPDCGHAWVQTSSLTEQLYGGGIGLPLSTSRRANVPFSCDRCRRTRHTSGRRVWRNWRAGRPLVD